MWRLMYVVCHIMDPINAPCITTMHLNLKFIFPLVIFAYWNAYLTTRRLFHYMTGREKPRGRRNITSVECHISSSQILKIPITTSVPLLFWSSTPFDRFPQRSLRCKICLPHKHKDASLCSSSHTPARRRTSSWKFSNPTPTSSLLNIHS